MQQLHATLTPKRSFGNPLKPATAMKGEQSVLAHGQRTSGKVRIAALAKASYLPPPTVSPQGRVPCWQEPTWFSRGMLYTSESRSIVQALKGTA